MTKETYKMATKIMEELKKKERILKDWKEAVKFGSEVRLISKSPDTNRNRTTEINIPSEYFGDIKKIMVGRLEYDIQRLHDEFDAL